MGCKNSTATQTSGKATPAGQMTANQKSGGSSGGIRDKMKPIIIYSERTIPAGSE